MARAVQLLLVVGGAWVVLVILAWVFQRSLIYLPDRTAPAMPDGVEEVALRTDDGLALTAWFVAPPDGVAATTVLVTPGNAGNRALRLPLATGLADRGHGVLLLDYRGYGGNPGRPDEAGLVADAVAGHRYLVDRDDVGAIAHLGESLGAGVAAAVAATDPPAALVLRSPFPSLAAVGRHHYPFLPVATLLRDRFEVAPHLAAYDGPVLVVVGDRDRIVPPAVSQEVAAGADAEVTVVPGADHNDRALLDGTSYLDAVDEFLRRVAADG